MPKGGMSGARASSCRVDLPAEPSLFGASAGTGVYSAPAAGDSD